MAARDNPYPHRYAQPLGPLRLQLAPDTEGGPAGGRWAPYSRDLTREAAHLVDHFPDRRGRVDRLVYAPCDWEVAPTEIYTRYGRIKVGFLPEDRSGGMVLVRLTSTGIVHLDIVWPPGT